MSFGYNLKSWLRLERRKRMTKLGSKKELTTSLIGKVKGRVTLFQTLPKPPDDS
jgi:hypothetical protein